MISNFALITLAFLCSTVLGLQFSFSPLRKSLYLGGESITFSLADTSAISEYLGERPIKVALMKKRPFYLRDKELTVVELGPNKFSGELEVPYPAHSGQYYLKAYSKKWVFGMKKVALAKSDLFEVKKTGLLVSPRWSRFRSFIGAWASPTDTSTEIRLVFSSEWNSERMKEISVDVFSSENGEKFFSIKDLSQYSLVAKEDGSFEMVITIDDESKTRYFYDGYFEISYGKKGVFYRSQSYKIHKMPLELIPFRCSDDQQCHKCEKLRELVRKAKLNKFVGEDQMKTICMECISKKLQDKLNAPSALAPEHISLRDIPWICKSILKNKLK